MKGKLILLTLITVFVLSLCAWGSEEDHMIWKQIKIVFSECKEMGTVIFEAQTDGQSFKSISITASGKQFQIEETDLLKFKGFPLSSLAVTHEAGYPRLGGHTVHFKMKRVYYKSKKLVEERIRISISKGKGLEIYGPETKETN